MTNILFLCVGNAARSQMAEGFARSLGIEAFSAGSHPASQVAPLAIEVMKEKSIDISSHTPKGFDALADKSFDYVVSMGCEKACPLVPGKKYIEWPIPEPKNKPIEEYRAIRDQIEEKVKELKANVSD